MSYQPISRNIGPPAGMNTSQLAHGDVRAFNCTWYDKQSQINKEFKVKYYCDSDSIELIDTKTKKLFLKKQPRPHELNTKDLYVGGRISFHGRDMTVDAYADDYTATKVGGRRQEAFILHPINENLGNVFDIIDQNDMMIMRVNAVNGESGVMVAISAVGPNSNDVINEAGIKTRTDLSDAQKAAYFTDSSKFAYALDNNSTCCVIQPSAVAEDNTGAIINQILEAGYEIAGMGMFQLNRKEAEEFHEVYKNVVPFYKEKVAELCSGPCIALEIRCEQAVETFRSTAGPWDVDMARKLDPTSLRGKYGSSNSKNGVHCTDLPQDAFEEVNYFFGSAKDPAMVTPLAECY